MTDLCLQDLLQSSLTVCTKSSLDTIRFCIRLLRPLGLTLLEQLNGFFLHMIVL